MNFKESIYWKIYGDVFAFHKKFAEPVEADAFWSSLVTEADGVYQKYKELLEGEFAKSLLLAVCGEIERSYKATNIHNGNTQKKRGDIK